MNSNNIKKYVPWGIMAIYLIILFVQHQAVFLYFDDFGYGSLTYNYEAWHGGTDYGLKEIIEFLKWHFFNWGGRVIPFFFEIILIKCGLWAIRLVQVLCIFGIAVFTYLIIKDDRDDRNIIKAFVIVLCYGTISWGAVVNGLFWYTASVLYVWPLMPLMAAMYLQKISKGRIYETVLTCVLLFFAACSYEQVAVLTIVFQLIYFIIKYFDNGKKIKASEIAIAATAIIAGLIEILAPGNFARSNNAMYADFYAKSIFGRIWQTIPTVLETNVGTGNIGMVIVLFISVLVILFELKKKEILSEKTSYIGMVVASFFYVMVALFDKYGYYESLRYVVLFIIAMIYFVLSEYMFIADKKYKEAAFLFAGLVCAGMMSVSPAIPERCYLPFFFVMTFCNASIIGDYADSRNKELLTVMLVIALAFSCSNMYLITRGYYNNAEVNRINDARLTEVSERIDKGETIAEVWLYKNVDPMYPFFVPYDDNYSFIVPCIKYYYDLPMEIQFIWTDYEK